MTTGVPFELHTSRYANKRIADTALLPVGITAGHPRFRLAYPLATNLKSLAPSRLWFELPAKEFELRYVNKLDEQGSTAFADELTNVFESASEHRGIVLLCYEDLNLPGMVCHRRMFAAWWERVTLQPVHELGVGESDLRASGG